MNKEAIHKRAHLDDFNDTPIADEPYQFMAALALKLTVAHLLIIEGHDLVFAMLKLFDLGESDPVTSVLAEGNLALEKI